MTIGRPIKPTKKRDGKKKKSTYARRSGLLYTRQKQWLSSQTVPPREPIDQQVSGLVYEMYDGSCEVWIDGKTQLGMISMLRQFLLVVLRVSAFIKRL